jgi:hypothetical protein
MPGGALVTCFPYGANCTSGPLGLSHVDHLARRETPFRKLVRNMGSDTKTIWALLSITTLPIVPDEPKHPCTKGADRIWAYVHK